MNIKNKIHKAETKAKHQGEINKIQSEYQTLLDRKLFELQSEASSHIAKNRTVDMELKTHLETKIAQLESDYILKSTHEALLVQESTRLKQAHQRELHELLERQEKEMEERSRDLAERRNYEMDHKQEGLKSELLIVF